jgi:hypothetical protein
LEKLKPYLPSDTDNEPIHFSFEGEQRLLKDRRKQELALSMKRLQLQHLLEEIEGLEETLGTYNRIFDPVRRLPTEILQAIFLLCAESEAERSSLRVNSTLWRITHVSRRWRDVASGYPKLWSKLNVTFSGETPRKRQAMAFLLYSFLSRSKSQPLDVHLYSRTVNAGTQYHPILPALFDSVPRWERLTLDITAETLCVLGRIRPDIHSLKSLRIRRIADVSKCDQESLTLGMRAFGNAHSISFLKANDPAVLRLELPWEGVSVLDISYVNGTGLTPFHFHVLHKAQNVERCRIKAPTKEYFCSYPVHLPRLTELLLVQKSERATANITAPLENIQANLSKLTLVSHSLNDNGIIGVLGSFIKTSQPDLQRLRIACRFNDSVETGDIDYFLADLPLGLDRLIIGELTLEVGLKLIEKLSACPDIVPNLRGIWILTDASSPDFYDEEDLVCRPGMMIRFNRMDKWNMTELEEETFRSD